MYRSNRNHLSLSVCFPPKQFRSLKMSKDKKVEAAVTDSRATAASTVATTSSTSIVAPSSSSTDSTATGSSSGATGMRFIAVLGLPDYFKAVQCLGNFPTIITLHEYIVECATVVVEWLRQSCIARGVSIYRWG